MTVDIKKVKELRDRTNVGLSSCKAALVKANNDVEKAIVELKKEGKIKAAKVSHKEVKAGSIFNYIHHNKQTASFVEILCQTEAAANTEQFKDFGESVCLQIVSMSPKWLSSADVPEDLVNEQREIFEAQIGKVPEDKKVHVVNNKLKKWFSLVCLMDQRSVVFPGKTIEALREELVQQTQENVVVKRFAHWKVGD